VTYYSTQIPRCGEAMTLIGFITERGSIQRILEHLGEPTRPPPIASWSAPRRLRSMGSRCVRLERPAAALRTRSVGELVGAAFNSPCSCRSLHLDRHRRISRPGTGYRTQSPRQPTGTAPTEHICPRRGPLSDRPITARPVRRYIAC
jgi:hypothetical protein